MDIMDRHGVMAELRHKEIFEIQYYDTVTSTNTLLKELAMKGAKEGTVVIAESQSAGRGRMDRRFHSPEGSGLYMSLLLKPDSDRAGRLTAMAAVAVCRSIKRVCGASAHIKWVNDILLHGRKVCGILAEAATGTGEVMFAVLGIGINVYRPSRGFPDEIADLAGNLAEAPQQGLRSRLAADILNELWDIYSKNEDVTGEYRAGCIVPGHRIDVVKNGVSVPALALEVDDECRLVVRYDGGEREALSWGEVSIKPTDG